jgi:NADH dehydrogenase (ubiquinone) Fe-S protein 1
MLRLPFLRSIPQVTRVATLGARTNSTGAPDKVEVFIDGQPVLVDPGTTVLQVIID